MNNSWYNKTPKEIFEYFQSNENGISSEEASRRLNTYGKNKLPEGKVDSLLVIFLKQFQSSLIYILLVTSLIILLMGEILDSLIIFAVLTFNAVVGTIQEGKARNTLLALKKIVESSAKVIREGKEVVISDSEVVPGDVLVLVEGDKVPADARIISSYNLKVDESSLTGESEPVNKVADTLDSFKVSIADQKNMVFKGTYIVSGSGKALVTGTGINTVIGKIAKEITNVDTETPLKTNIRYLSKLIIIAVLIISTFIFSYGIFSGKSAREMFATVVSLSVSIIPEGLPVVVTLILATGVWRMSKQNVLVKRLQAVEALGQAKIIAVDKTGTITKNELVVRKLFVDNKFFEVGGIGYEPKGNIFINGKIIEPSNHPEILLLGKVAYFCTNAYVAYDSENKKWQIFGDPTEAALTVFGEKVGFNKNALENEFTKIDEIPFDYKTKYHVTAYKFQEKIFISLVGAPEVILNLSSKLYKNNSFSRISKRERSNLESTVLQMSGDGFRVLAAAYKEIEVKKFNQKIQQKDISNLIFVGFMGMKDTLRPEVKNATNNFIASGIRVVVITGDHKLTAKSIAKEAGIYKEGDEILTGEEIDAISDDELSKKIDKVSVFARVTPEHKLRIINAYRKRGEIIAMTGDGVNDAPSLVAADLGVAMGKIGTEVAKEASDLVLLDDNFGSIINGIEEGRSIYKTIKKVILYLFSTSMGEVLTISGALLLGYPIPIMPVQIIWLNFVTDGFLVAALSMEPKEKDLLRKNYAKDSRYFVDRLMVKRIFFMSLSMMVGALFLFKNYFEVDMVKAWTISLTTLAVFQWFNAWNCRHETKSIFQMNLFSNKFLLLSTFIVVFLQLLAIYNPFMQKLLKTTEISFFEWVKIIFVASLIVFVEEVRKFLSRRTEKLFYDKEVC